MPAQRLPRPLVLGLAVAVASVPLVRYLNRHGAINPFDPSGGRIATFELQTGEVAVMVRVRHDATPSAGVAVWAEPVNRDDEDSDQPRYRKGKTDRSGLAKVPVLKGHGGLTRLFARDSNGRVGGGTIQGERLLSAGDVVLSDVAPRAGRLVTTTGEPIRGAKIAAETFSPGFGTNGEGITLIEIPEPLRRDYTVTTDRDGRFEMPGVPNGFGCRATFDTAGYGEGELTFPATAPWECTLAPAGEIGILVGGDGTAADAKGMKLVVTASDTPATFPQKVHVNGYHTVRHDGSTTFRVRNVVPAAYRVQLEGGPKNPLLPEAPVSPTVPTGGSVENTFALKKAGRITGRVIDGESSAGVSGVKLQITALPDFYGWVRTEGDGRFEGYVPADRPVTVFVRRVPSGYVSDSNPFAAMFNGGGKPVTAASGETATVPDIKLSRPGALSGTVVADGKPVPGATVEIRWGQLLFNRQPATLKTDGEGRFRITDAPPGHAVSIRVRANKMVNPVVFFRPEELAGSLTIPVSEATAFRARGRLTDGRGGPVAGAKVVVTATPTLTREAMPANFDSNNPEHQKAHQFSNPSFMPAEVEAVFTTGSGEFETGPLWPGCQYQFTATADGRLSRQFTAEGKAGETFDAKSIALPGAAATVSGTVVGLDGKPVAGATVVNSGDGSKRVTATTDIAGRFTLSGLFGGPVALVAHKPGHRTAWAVARPGDTEPRVTLRILNDPPAPIAPPSEEQKRAEAGLISRLTEIETKWEADRPKPPAVAHQPDFLVEAEKDVDAFIAKHSKPGTSPSHTLAPAAGRLAKTDREKALRLLRAAAASARRYSMGADGPGAAMIAAFAGDMSGGMRAMELIRVAGTAQEIGAKEEAIAWLTEAEGMAANLSPDLRRQPLEMLAAAWVTIDPARTDRLLAQITDKSSADTAVWTVIGRLLAADPRKAVPWLDRFHNPTDWIADEARAQTAVKIAALDFPTALRVADPLRSRVNRSLTFARLATSAPKGDPKAAHDLIDKAAAALTAEPDTNSTRDEYAAGAAIYLIWQADAVGYPDPASLVAVALLNRRPVPQHESTYDIWRRETVQTAAAVASRDPAAARALLGGGLTAADRETVGEYSEYALIFLALTDPTNATKNLDAERDRYSIPSALAVLKDRRQVIDSLNLLDKLWWVRDGIPTPTGSE